LRVREEKKFQQGAGWLRGARKGEGKCEDQARTGDGKKRAKQQKGSRKIRKEKGISKEGKERRKRGGKLPLVTRGERR